MSWAKFNRLSSSKDLSIFRRGTTAFDGGGGGGAPNDPDAQAYIDALDASGYTVSGAEETAINNHFLDLKGTGPNNSTYDWWTGCVRLLPFIGTNAAQQGIEGQNPASSINFYGGMIFSSIGAEGNGTNAYFDFFAPNEIPDDRDMSVWIYSSKDVPISTGFVQRYLYWFESGRVFPSPEISVRYGLNLLFQRVNSYFGSNSNQFYGPQGSILTTGGFFGQSRYLPAGSGGYDIYANGVRYVETRITSQDYTNNSRVAPALASKVNDNPPTLFQDLAFGYALITTGVSTTTEEAALRACVEAFMTALNRNVP
jgi:hypothetical protein